MCTGTSADAYWPHLVYAEVQVAEIIENRMMMKAALGRYMRQSVLQWDDVEVTEIRAWYERLKELLDNEAPTRSATED